MASAACMKIAGVPVEFKVATILVAMLALLPIPVTTTLPLLSKMAGATREAKAVSEGDAEKGVGYRETDHVKTYYTLAKF